MMRAEIFCPGLSLLASRLEFSITGNAVPVGICCAEAGAAHKIAKAEKNHIHLMPHHLPTRCQTWQGRLAECGYPKKNGRPAYAGRPICSRAALSRAGRG